MFKILLLELYLAISRKNLLKKKYCIITLRNYNNLKKKKPEESITSVNNRITDQMPREKKKQQPRKNVIQVI